MTQSNARKPLYFVGWDYFEPLGLPLKRLLMNAAGPFEVKAIVHQVVMAPEVDGIEVIQTEEFLTLAKGNKLQAVLMVKDELSRSLWLRRGRDVGIDWLDEGELLLQAKKALSAQSANIDLGILKLPEAFDHELIEPLATYAGAWPDAASNGVFRAYLQFLETGVLSPLRSASVFRIDHPMRQAGARSIAACAADLNGGLAWEIATHRSSFLEQVVLVAGRHHWRYAYSADTQERGIADVLILKGLLSPLGSQPAASWFDIDTAGNYTEHALPAFDVPVRSGLPYFVRVDVDLPLKIVTRLFEESEKLTAWVRVGRTPRQLLQLLQHFPISNMALDCDRPGPLGLQVRLKRES